MEIHMKGLGYSGISCPVYLLAAGQNPILKNGILIGNVILRNGVSDGRITFSSNNIGDSGYHWEQATGFAIFPDEEHMFASQWEEGELLRANIRLPEAEEKEEDPSEPDSDLVPVSEPEIVAASDSELAPPPNSDGVSTPETANPRKTNLQAQSGRSQPVIHPVNVRNVPGRSAENFEETSDWPEKWEFILEQFPVITPFQEEPDIHCVRIELKDLRLLPKRLWYLGNNSFLLHGFFNYHYLILGAMGEGEKKRWFLGIPGVFQNQERVMASIFGFPEYKGEKKTQQKTGQFGYWLRLI